MAANGCSWQRAILPQVLARSYSIIRNEQADGQMRRANSREPTAAGGAE
jgi:hypothetical protein